MSCYVVIRLDGNRRLVLCTMGKKQLTQVLDGLGSAVLARETAEGFVPENPTDPNKSIAQNLSGIFEVATGGDPRFVPLHRWGSEMTRRINEIRQKGAPRDPVAVMLAQLRDQGSEEDEPA